MVIQLILVCCFLSMSLFVQFTALDTLIIQAYMYEI